MYAELLKEFYYKERKKLEEMRVFKQESKLKFIRVKKDTLEKIEGRLSIAEIMGRNDITEEIKDNLLRNRNNEDKLSERLAALIEEELSGIEREEKEELRNADYSAYDFAEYLFQLEKVSVLEAELENNRLFADAVYEEQKEITKKESNNKIGGEA